MSDFTHPGLTVTYGQESVCVEAHEDATRAWAHRPGYAWPCSDLAGESFVAHFDRDGLFEIEGEPAELFNADELNAFTSDAIRPVLPTGHPAYDVTVGQFA